MMMIVDNQKLERYYRHDEAGQAIRIECLTAIQPQPVKQLKIILLIISLSISVVFSLLVWESVPFPALIQCPTLATDLRSHKVRISAYLRQQELHEKDEAGRYPVKHI